MAHHLRFTITATATITVVRFLHLFKFGLVVYGASVAPSTGGNREIPAFVFCLLNEYVRSINSFQLRRLGKLIFATADVCFGLLSFGDAVSSLQGYICLYKRASVAPSTGGNREIPAFVFYGRVENNYPLNLCQNRRKNLNFVYREN